MRETHIYKYYAFGYNYYILKNIGLSNTAKSDGHSKLQEFLNTLKELDLKVSTQAAKELYEIFESIKKLPEESQISEDVAKRVQAIVDRVDSTLDAELQLRSAYIVTDKRYAIENLLNKPEALFGKSIFEYLPKLCQFDFTEACRCIAYENATAAAFHIMRAIEGTLRFYYNALTKRNKLHAHQQMWSNIITALRNKKKPSIPKPMLDALDHIRANFRNPTQHPEMRYNIDEAQDLLAIGIDAVSRIVNDMKQKGLIKKSPLMQIISEITARQGGTV